MSVVKMNKITLIGLENDKENILQSLMKIGVVEISDMKQTDSNNELLQLTTQDGAEDEVSEIENKLDKVKSAISCMSNYNVRKKSIFNVRRTVNIDEYSKAIHNSEGLWNIVDTIQNYDKQLSSLKSKQNQLSNLIETLTPWNSLCVPIELTSTKYTSLFLGVVPSVVDTSRIQKDLEDNVPEAVIDIVNEDKDQIYLSIICHKTVEESVMQILKQYSFNTVSFKELTGTINENIQKINSQINHIKNEIENIKKDITKLSGRLNDIEVLYDYLLIQRDKKIVLSNLVKTDKTFMLTGWVPEKLVQKVKTHISEKWDCIIDIKQPEEDENVPILLKNGKIGSSVETITEMYSLPDYKELDPNTIMGPFFIIFFGLMLSDGGYGLLLAAIASIALIKFDLEEHTKRFMKLMLYCGISTIFWGAMFGGWFGFEAKPIWFSPVRDPERLLKYSLLFGIIHIYVGLAARGYNLYKDKKYIDIIFDVVTWYVFFTGAVMAVLPYVPSVDKAVAQQYVQTGKYLLAVGTVSLILTQGRNQKNIVMKIFMGFASLYDLVSFMSDVLSYSRLLALGLATGVVASIVNEMGKMGGMNVLGVIVFIAVFLLGHTFNFLINSLSAYVHSSRLQYIEFFGKFYKGGGKKFKPFRIDTKYIKIQTREEV